MQRSALLTKVALQDLEDEERGDRTRFLRHVRSSTRIVPAPLKLHSGSSLVSAQITACMFSSLR